MTNAFSELSTVPGVELDSDKGIDHQCKFEQSKVTRCLNLQPRNEDILQEEPVQSYSDSN